MKIIKNPSLNWINTNFRGKTITIKPKGSLACPDGEEGDSLFEYLTQTYQFLQDKTPKVTYEAPKTNAEIKKVVRKAQSKRGVKRRNR